MKLSSNNAETMESLRNERNQYRILVDITNSVLAHLDMDGLISEVSKEIHRFFGLNHISLMLCRTSSHNSHEGILYSSRYQTGKSVIRQQRKFSSANNKAEEIINQNKPVLIDINKEDQEDVLIKRLVKQNMQTALLLPLAFNHKPLGLLILAHEISHVFTDDTCQLLQQIAA
ncbi:GAF domain-containing protein, partial [Klebsiella variicola subsp. variicola]